MKVYLVLDLDKEEDRFKYDLINKADDMYFALSIFDNELRNEIKYKNANELQPARDLLWKVLDDYKIDLDMG